MAKCHCDAPIIHDIEINTPSGSVRQQVCACGHILIRPVDDRHAEVGSGGVSVPTLLPHPPDPGPNGINNLDGGVCPDCNSDDSEVEEHFIQDRSVDVHYICNKCHAIWHDVHEFKRRVFLKKGGQ